MVPFLGVPGNSLRNMVKIMVEFFGEPTLTSRRPPRGWKFLRPCVQDMLKRWAEANGAAERGDWMGLG